MKKIMKPFVLVAAAAMALASCQKNEISAPEKQDVHFTINAGIETKTSIDETLEDGKTVYKAKWDGNEKLGVLFAAPNEATVDDNVVVLTNYAEAGELASFQGDVTVDPTARTFYSFYPASAFNRGYKEGDARLDLKNVQKPTATSFDPLCDILVAKPYDYEVVDGKVVADGLEFARLMSVLRIDLKSEFADVQNEFVESVSFTAGDVKITGYARIFLDNPKFTGNWASSGDQWCTVTANYDSDLVSINGESKSVYLVIAPVTIPADKDLTFEIKTKNYNISKTVKSPEMKFTAGKVSKINLTINEENCEKVDMTVDYSGEYLIVGKEGEKWYAAKKYTSGNYLAVSEIEFVGENIIETETISDHYMTIEKVVGGDYDGMYTIVDAGGKYLSTSSSSSNDMKAVESASKDTYWTIVKDDAKGSYSIVASKSQYSRNDMRFNYNNGTNSRVSCYDGSKTNLPYFTLFSTSLVKPDTTPKIIVENTSYSVKATDTSVEIPYKVKNIIGTISATVADDATISNINTNVTDVTDVTDGKVTISFAANNESAEKTATIVLSYEGAESVNVTVTQAAAGVAKQYYVKVTTAPTDWSGTYLMVCESKNMALSSISTTSTKYGIGSSVTISDGKIEATDANASWQVVISKASVTSGAYRMAFAGKYLYWTSGNSLTTNASEVKNANWNISITNATLKISNCGTSSRQIMWNASSPRFACYEGGQTSIQLYKLEGGETPEPDEPETPVEPTLSPRNLAFSSATATATMGQAFTEPTLSGETAGVTYSSSNTGVATVNASTGAVTLVGAGTTTITATAPETEQYEAGEVSYTLTVNAAQKTGYTLITDLSEITTGQYVIAAKVSGKYYAMSKTFASKITGTEVSVSNDAITESAAANYVVTITKSGSNYTIKSGSNYLKYSSSTNLGTQTSAYNWTIAKGTKGTFRFTSGTSTRGLVFRASTYKQFGGYALSNVTANGTEYYDVELFKLN